MKISKLWKLSAAAFAVAGICGCASVSPEASGRIAELLDDVIQQSVERGEVHPAPVVVTNDAPKHAPVVSNAPTAAGILQSAKWNKFPRVDFVAPEIEKWPRTGSKNVCAQLFLNGRKVEWIAAGRGFSTVHNALPIPVKNEDGNVIGYTRGKYFQDLKSGDTVTISIADLNGKNESNRITLVVT